MVSTKSARHYTRQRSFSDTCRAMEEPLSAFLLNQLLNCGYYFFLPETDFADGNKKCGSLKRLVADRRQRAQDPPFLKKSFSQHNRVDVEALEIFSSAVVFPELDGVRANSH
jgi:hypothetical protein